jgi:aspartyl protease family protein
MHRAMKKLSQAAIFFIATFAINTWTTAQSVALSGVMGSKALLVIDGGTPKAVAAGEAHQGVKVISVSGEQALVDIKGQRVNMRVGDAPVSQGARPGGTNGSRIVLTQGSGGHFFAQGLVNGRTVQFMVDTGATTIALGASDATRMGIDYQKGRPVRMGTANGVAQGWLIKLGTVKIADVEVYEVDAVVGPDMPYALLGNSFLSRFNMNKTIDQMVLEKRF